MAYKIDLEKTIPENFVGLLKDANPSLDIEPSQFTLGAASPRTPDTDTNNTTITITAVANAGFSGSAPITYTRLALDKGKLPQPVRVLIAPTDTQTVIRDKILAAYGLYPSEIEFMVDGTAWNETTNKFIIPVNEDDTSSTVTIKHKLNSLLYIGPNITATLTVPDTDVPLMTAIAVKQMAGFAPATS